MNIHELVAKLHGSCFDFTYPHNVTMASKFVTMNGKKVGYYRIMKSELGEGLVFKFQERHWAQFLSTIGRSIDAEVHYSGFLNSVIIYPRDSFKQQRIRM